LIRLAVRVASEQAELVLAELLELAPSGVEERELADGVIEYAVYGRASCRSCPRSERRPPTRWSRSAPRRSPTTGPSAGAAFTGRSCSAGA
jgi:hypothetical protein